MSGRAVHKTRVASSAPSSSTSSTTMRFVSGAALLALAGLAYADEPSDVLSLTSSNFLSVVNKESLMLVEFFAPWSVIHLPGHSFALPSY